MNYIRTNLPILKGVNNFNNISNDCSYDVVIYPIDQHGLEQLTSNGFKIFSSSEENQNIVKKSKSESFKAECGESLYYSFINEGGKSIKVILHGMGKKTKNNSSECSSKNKDSCNTVKIECNEPKKCHILFEKCGAKSMSCVSRKEKIVISAGLFQSESPECDLYSFASGIMQSLYRFSKYLTTDKQKEKLPKIKNIDINVSGSECIAKKIECLSKTSDAIYFVRDLVNEPGNILYPESYSEIVEDELKKLKVKVTVIGKKELEKMGMHMLLGVGLGSDKESKVVIAEYIGNSEKKDFDIAIIGKGVTFDTGGISIKPAAKMDEMKTDMAGSAVAAGIIKLLASRSAKVNAIGVLGLVENAINGSAQRPGDIVKSLSGQTVEVLNTDAEGRLVLGDLLYHISTKYKPKYMIDLATLTGAIVVSLGNYYAGLFTNCDELAGSLTCASKKTGESVWRMPLDERFDKMMDSDVADIKNISGTGSAGSITAAQFLQRFIAGHQRWAHLDIAGVARAEAGNELAPKGSGTGFGIKLLNQFIKDNIEHKDSCK